MMEKTILIIGAGPCGLGAAWRLTEHQYRDFLIVEQHNFPGGLAASVVNKGFTWDFGGHVIYSDYPYFKRVLDQVLGDNCLSHERASFVYMLNRYIPFPLQYNIHFLPKKVFRECLTAIKQRKKIKPKNYAEWLLANFGEGIANHFQVPYAQKLWAYPPEKMDFHWYGRRVAPLDTDRILQNIHQSQKDSTWGPNFTFYYPKKGGNGAVWTQMAKRFTQRIRYNTKVVKIDLENKMAFLANGKTIRYRYLLSSMPLDTLLSLVGMRNVDTKDNLEFSMVKLVGVGIKGRIPQVLKDTLWIYYPEKDTPFYRANILSNFSASMAPNDSWSILTETSFSRKNQSQKDIKELVINTLKRLHYLSAASQITSVWSHTKQRAYPIPTLQRDHFLKKTLPLLEKESVFSRGRFGLWKYEVGNQDHSFMQGVEWVDKLLFGKPEVTIENKQKGN